MAETLLPMWPEATKQGLRESRAVERLQGMSKPELADLRTASRSAGAPAEMKALLEAVYHVLLR